MADPALRALAAELTRPAPGPRDHALETLVADGVGALAVGAATPEGRAIAALADTLGRGDDGRAWSRGALDELLVRVAVTRLTELDDIHRPTCTTPGSVVIPTAITLGAASSASPERFAAAVEAGYEAMTRLGRAIDGAHVVYRGVWPTQFAAAFAAAAVTARLLDLDLDTTAHALGIALSRSTGNAAPPVGSRPARWLGVGDAARTGAVAAQAARAGFESTLALDRFAAGAGVELDAGALAEDGRAIETISVKPFPCAKQAVAATAAALRLRGRVSPEDVKAITVHVPAPTVGLISMPPADGVRVSRIVGAPWNVALALLRLEALDDVERLLPVDDPEVAELAARVAIRADPELTAYYPMHWPARVEVELRGGQKVVETVIDAPGDPGAEAGPSVTGEGKWRGVHAAALGADAPTWRRLARNAAREPVALAELDVLVRDFTAPRKGST